MRENDTLKTAKLNSKHNAVLLQIVFYIYFHTFTFPFLNHVLVTCVLSAGPSLRLLFMSQKTNKVYIHFSESTPAVDHS